MNFKHKITDLQKVTVIQPQLHWHSIWELSEKEVSLFLLRPYICEQNNHNSEVGPHKKSQRNNF